MLSPLGNGKKMSLKKYSSCRPIRFVLPNSKKGVVYATARDIDQRKATDAGLEKPEWNWSK